MIELLAFDKCPICSRAGRDNNWQKFTNIPRWFEKTCEKMCSNYYNYCGFSQNYWTSYEDSKLKYIQWHIKDFTAYTYSTAYANEAKNLAVIPGTRFYHKKSPRVGMVYPFQDWYDFVPDWDNLEKLNNRLKLLRTFE